MHALVTGAGGFLGHAVAEQLVARGDRVRVLTRVKKPELDRLGVEYRLGVVQNRQDVMDACRGPQPLDCVFHVAAKAGIWGSWYEYLDVNVNGTLNVVAACREFLIPRLVYTSSPSVTFDGRDQCGIDESAPYAKRWLAHYPHSKALAEQAVLEANGKDGLWTCALRPHLIWGPGDQHLIPRLIDRARKGQLRRVGDGKNLIDTIYVENAAAAHLLAADRLKPSSPVCGRAYFLSQGEPVNCWEWIDQVLALAGIAPIRQSISFRAAYMAGAMLEGVWWLLGRTDEPRMTRFLAAQLATSHYFDISRARADLDYAPTVSLAEGMERLGKAVSGEW
ncbi:MAG TPA: NAD-dependent epimerase/dehydratase family protein [Pirellulaceae bacterium]|nr:NAD-dependent epimerase/dehydratase family protein [Pirellulaceae bacterium]